MKSGRIEKSELGGKHTPPSISVKIEQLEQRIRQLEIKVLILQNASRTGYEHDMEGLE